MNRKRDQPTTRKQCWQYLYCIESSRMYPCKDFAKHKPSDKQMSVKDWCYVWAVVMGMMMVIVIPAFI